MRITFLLPGMTMSGGVKVVRRIADGLVERGHDVTLVLTSELGPWPPPWRPRRLLRRARETLQHVSNAPTLGFLNGTRAAVVRLSRGYHRASDVPDADAVVATWWETAESMRSFPARKGRKVYFVQGDETKISGPEVRTRIRATHAAGFRSICVSTFLRDMLETGYGHRDVALVPVGVDDIFFRNSGARRKGDPPTVGVLYHTHPLKGWRVAMRALELVRARLPQVRVGAFGAIPVEPRDRLPNMTFDVLPSQERIVEIASAADVWLLPSESEGFGLPPIEAAATGTPIVATRCGGPADFVSVGENGFLVDVGDAAAMADALYRVLSASDDEWRGMSTASASIAQRFRWTDSILAFERALQA